MKQRPREKPRLFIYVDPGVIKNCNTVPPISEAEFIYENAGRYIGSQVDAIVISMFNWSDVLPSYPTEVPEARRICRDTFCTAGDWREQVNLQWMIEKDPWHKLIDVIHDAGLQYWAGMRFNDCHDRPWQTEFRANHPDYVLGKESAAPAWKGKFCPGFNYGLPEVRAHRLRIVEEVCTRYDLDGFEWDFTRSQGVHFTDMDEGREIMNEYMREARALLDRIGEKRGRPVGFGVRPCWSLRISHDLALDVETWIKEGLVDHVCPGPVMNSFTEPIFQPFVSIAKGTDCSVYGCTTDQGDHRWNYASGGWGSTPPEVMRAGALNAWREGVDGMYVYNIHNLVTHDSKDLGCLDVVHEVGALETLEFKDKVYNVSWCDRDMYGYEHMPPVELDVDPDGPGKTIKFTVGDDFKKAAQLGVLDKVILELIIGEPANDVVHLTLNGRLLPENPLLAGATPIRIKGRRMESNMRLVFDLTAGDWIRQGLNELNVKLRAREPSITMKFTVYDVTVKVNYRRSPLRAKYR